MAILKNNDRHSQVIDDDDAVLLEISKSDDIP